MNWKKKNVYFSIYIAKNNLSRKSCQGELARVNEA